MSKAPISLTEAEAKLAEELKQMLADAQKNEWKCDYDKLADLAHQLHKSLALRKLEPVHHSYMIKNRGSRPGTKDFYHHVHPVQDLLKFIEDQDANKDPEDKTIGTEFKFSVYSQRWGHDDTYKLKRIKSGWHVSHIGITGDCDQEGNPYLFKNLHQDFISYPRSLGSYMSSIWERAESEGLKPEQVQSLIDRVAKWVSECERTKPKDILL